MLGLMLLKERLPRRCGCNFASLGCFAYRCMVPLLADVYKDEAWRDGWRCCRGRLCEEESQRRGPLVRVIEYGDTRGGT